MWSAARALFDEADTDHSGLLDDEELNALLIKLQKTLPSSSQLKGDTRMNMLELVRGAISRFDVDGDNKLDFDEFMHMLSIKPWSDMLPEDARNKLHFGRIRQAQGRERSSSASSPSTSSSAFLRAAHRLFQKTDVDDNGVLSRAELGYLLRAVAVQEGRKSDGLFDELDSGSDLLDTAISKHGVDGSVDFEGFITIMSANPWKNLLPKEAMDDLVLTGKP